MTSPRLLLEKKGETSIFLSCAFCCVREFCHVISNVHFEFQAETELRAHITNMRMWNTYVYIYFGIYIYFFGLMIYHLCLCVPLCGVGNKLLSFENGENCLDLRELLWEGSPLDVLTGRSYHGQDIFAISSPDHGRLVDFVHTITRKGILKEWDSYSSNVDIIGQTGWEDNVSH